jgi:hypothetical protein
MFIYMIGKESNVLMGFPGYTDIILDDITITFLGDSEEVGFGTFTRFSLDDTGRNFVAVRRPV